MATQEMPSRPLGATGVTVPVIGYGTAPLGKPEVSRKHAEACLNHAIDRGVTYLDTSPGYGSEPHIGAVMRTRRDEVFLATKVDHRKRESVLDEIHQSLERLQTDHIDVIQVHAVNAWADLEQVLALDGTVTALEEAREQGLVRFFGITGHARPEILGQALDRYAFDTVLVALGMADRLVTSPETFVLPRAVERNTGVIAMKVFGHGVFPRRDLALRYSLGLPGVSLAILGMDDISQIDENVDLAANLASLTDEEEGALVDDVRPLVERDASESQENGKSDLFWLHDTKVMGWQKDDEPVMVSY